MKRWLVLAAVVGAAAGMMVHGNSRGQVPAAPASAPASSPFDLGPGAQGATLRLPSQDAAARPATPPNPLQGLYHPAALPNPDQNPGMPRPQARQVVFNQTDINADLELPANVGPWLILAMNYVGEGAPQKARQFVMELRTTYKMNAYVFNFGREEKVKELQRAETEREKQREALRQAGLSTTLPIRVRVEHIQEQTGVLIADNYQSREQSLRDLQRMRKLPPPDPRKVELYIQYIGMSEKDDKGNPTFKKINVDDRGAGYVNPFCSAFPVRNPKVSQEATPEDTKAEVEYLRRINTGEPCSLFNCKGNFTLMIKQFKMPILMQDNPNDAKGFFDRLSLKKVERKDVSAENAHNVAEGFRKAGLADTYVLHAKHCSYVTVGGFDTLEDPRLLAMQNFLQERFSGLDALRPLELEPRPIPMQVPR